jgi:hypothetical protein
MVHSNPKTSLIIIDGLDICTYREKKIQFVMLSHTTLRFIEIYPRDTKRLEILILKLTFK